MITIRHTRTDGTLVYGTSKGDGAGAILRRATFRPSRHLPVGAYWYLPHSRDKAAKRYRIDQVAQALRAAGFDVEIEIDDATPSEVGFAEREQARDEWAEQRAERYAERAARAGARGEAGWEQARQMASAIPLGQPLLVDHHSYNRDRRYRDRIHAKEGKAVADWDRARYWAGRANAAENYQRYRESLPTTLRRIDKLESQRRRLLRGLDGRVQWIDDDGGPALVRRGDYILRKVKPEGEYKARLEADLAQVDEELAYWQRIVAEAQEAGAKVWGPDDFTKGDFVHVGRRWFEVLRVNKRSLTLPALITTTKGDVVRAADSHHTHRLPYDQISRRKTAAEINVELAEEVSGQVGREGSDESEE